MSMCVSMWAIWCYCSQRACTTYLRVCTTYRRVFMSPIIATTCLSWIKFFVHQCNSRKTEKIRQPWHHCQTKHVQIRAIKTVVVAYKDRLARFVTKVIEWNIDQVGGTIPELTEDHPRFLLNYLSAKMTLENTQYGICLLRIWIGRLCDWFY